MTLHPLEPRSATVLLSLFDLFKDLFDQVLILYGSSDTRNPVILDPIDMPDGDAINSILRICINEYLAVQRGDIDGTKDCGKFCSLVGLAGAYKGF